MFMVRMRKVVSILLLYSLIILLISGIVLYIAPRGRYANWNNWTLMELSKTQWEDVHTIVGYLMVLLSVIHIYLNWKPMINYLKRSGKLFMSYEFLGSTVFFILIIWGIIAYVPPFSNIMDLGEKFTDSWENRGESASVPHMELMDIRELSKYKGVSADSIVRILQSHGYECDINSTLQNIGEKYNISPAELNDLIDRSIRDNGVLREHDEYGGEEEERGGGYGQSGKGFGRLTISEVIKENNLKWDIVESRLKKEGITADKNGTIRDIADKYGLRPSEVYDIIVGGE